MPALSILPTPVRFAAAHVLLLSNTALLDKGFFIAPFPLSIRFEVCHDQSALPQPFGIR